MEKQHKPRTFHCPNCGANKQYANVKSKYVHHNCNGGNKSVKLVEQ